MSLDETIQYIDQQIGEMINKMINARTKHIDAINAILTKIASIQDSALASYTYRQGRTYDRMVKVESPITLQFDIEKPTLKLQYIGNKMSLYHDSTEIKVPETPIFVFEAPSPPATVHEVGIELLKQSLYMMFPVSANIVTPPDVENSFGKFYKMDLYDHNISDYSFSWTAPPPVGLPPSILTVIDFTAKERWYFRRDLTIDSELKWFNMLVYPGVIKYNMKVPGSTEETDIESDAILFRCATEYTDDMFWIIFNNRYEKGIAQDSMYLREVLMISWQNRIVFKQVT